MKSGDWRILLSVISLLVVALLLMARCVQTDAGTSGRPIHTPTTYGPPSP